MPLEQHGHNPDCVGVPHCHHTFGRFRLGKIASLRDPQRRRLGRDSDALSNHSAVNL